MASTESRYLPPIEGLRAIAVLAVVAFHLRPAWLPGGFLGVDVFFVISGFVITRELARDGAGSLAAFYQRRIARILPAAAVTIAVTLIGAALLFDDRDAAWVGTDATAAITATLNLRLIGATDYFAAPIDAQPLLHFWSLAVEEQFYLVFPALVWITASRRRRTVYLALAITSLGAAAWLSARHSAIAFYAPVSRAWEFLAGSIVAASPASRRWLAGRLSLTGAGLIAGALAWTWADAPMRLAGSLMAVAGAGCLIARAAVDDGSHPDALGRLLSAPALTAIGHRSYSIYLCHWPIFSFVEYACFRSAEPVRAAIKVALLIPAALASYHLVERPARSTLRRPEMRRTAFVLGGCAVALIAGTGLYVRRTFYLDASPSSVIDGGRTLRSGRRVVVVSGDSLATMYAPAIVRWARSRGYTVHLLGTPGRTQLPERPGTLWPEVEAFVARTQPDIVVLANSWSIRMRGDPQPLRAALAGLRGRAGRVVLLAQPPGIPAAATRDGVRGGASPPFHEPAFTTGRRLRALAILRGEAGGCVTVIDPASLLIGQAGVVAAFSKDGTPHYRDVVHLTSQGVSVVVTAIDSGLDRADRGCGAGPAHVDRSVR